MHPNEYKNTNTKGVGWLFVAFKVGTVTHQVGWRSARRGPHVPDYLPT